MEDQKKPEISVVVVTYNDRERLLECLASLEEQTYPPAKHEIIVIDDGSTDGTSALVKELYPEFRLIEKENTGPDNSRNWGIKEATGEILAFIDSDCTASADWMEQIMASLTASDSTIVGGHIAHRGSFWTRMIGVSDFGELQAPFRKVVSNIPTCNMAVRRDIAARVGFDPQLRIGGDVIFCNTLRRLGHCLLYVPEIKVEHQPDTSLTGFFGRAYRYGEGFVSIRRIEPTLPYASWVKSGVLSVVMITLGRAILDWYRLLRYRRQMNIRIYEIPLATIVLLFKRLFSCAGAIKACCCGRQKYAYSSHN